MCSRSSPKTAAKLFQVRTILATYTKEIRCRSVLLRAVLDLRLAGELVDVLEGRHQRGDGEESGQIRRVRGDHDQREEPPDAACSARRNAPKNRLDLGGHSYISFVMIHRSQIGSLLHQSAYSEPQTVPDAELIDEVFGLLDAGIRIRPFAGRQAAHNKKCKRY